MLSLYDSLILFLSLYDVGLSLSDASLSSHGPDLLFADTLLSFPPDDLVKGIVGLSLGEPSIVECPNTGELNIEPSI
jgi:hypothetical protein